MCISHLHLKLYNQLYWTCFRIYQICFLLEYNFDQYSIFQYLIRLQNTNFEMYHVYKINFSSKQYQCKLNCFMFLVVSHLFLLNLIFKYISCQMSRQNFISNTLLKTICNLHSSSSVYNLKTVMLPLLTLSAEYIKFISCRSKGQTIWYVGGYGFTLWSNFFDSQLKHTFFFRPYQKQTFFSQWSDTKQFFSPHISFDSLHTTWSSWGVTTFTWTFYSDFGKKS